MTDGADDFAVLLHLIEVGLDGRLPSLVLPATRRTHKALLLRTVPSPIAWDTSGKQREREGRGEGATPELISNVRGVLRAL